MFIYKDKDINDTPALLLRSADAKDFTFGSLTIPDSNPTPSQTSSTGSRQLSVIDWQGTYTSPKREDADTNHTTDLFFLLSNFTLPTHLTPNADNGRP